MNLRNLPFVFSAGLLVLAACGSDYKNTAASTAAVASIPGSANFNAADVTFVQGMIPHHKQAIEMADIALGSAVNASSSVADLATRIKRAKDPEIKMMQSWLTSWGRSMPTEVDTQQMPAMSGTISGDDMAHLGAARNLDFDTLWLEMMIHHHEGAITMAQQEKVSGSNTDARALADRILATQQTEIDEMKSMVGGD